MEIYSFFFLVLSFFISAVAIVLINPLAKKVGLVDIPNQRKHHVGSTPLIGGVCIYIGVLIISLLFLNNIASLNVYILSSTIILVLGVLDDKFDLSVRLRIVVQIFCASLMVFYADVYLSSFGNILGDFEFTLNSMGGFISIVAVIAVINAFNMMDGIDGLAGVLSLVTFFFLAVMLFSVNSMWAALCLIYISSISAFLIFNLRLNKKYCEKIFMGDAGSMLIGFTIVWLLIEASKDNVGAIQPVTALYFIAIPLMDMVAIMYRRLKKKKSPFKPDRDHLHHIFERAGLSRKRSLVWISIFALIIALFGSFLQFFGIQEWVRFYIFIGLFFIYNYSLSHIWRILSWIRKR
ncbi:UDP-N-acetylglucosamine--undecaprenyl-phosphate N-acetylglucosaminephosphotransferase [Pseudoalteromonas sp. BZB3]|uniref:UDP-N-acetylglucosamine--undecaprenyl-phosphate N-acetylglucosaminephosphotransferase n=1 Tax=Pseudoalteromonas sp. BZB3 TaxID=3136670 RepID=UPI0032C440F4